MIKTTERWLVNVMVIWCAAAIACQSPTGKGDQDDTSAEGSSRADRSPGGYHATLTLGDGRKIVLDSARNTNLAVDGGAQIIKKADGQLEYQKSDTKATAQGQTQLYNAVTTPRGGQYQVKLPDGSTVILNAASKITFPTQFSAGERIVFIEGEAWFDIAKDAKRPFTVKARDITVQVLGTRFNVNSYGDEARVSTTLLEGLVVVKNGIALEKLKPGQQAALSKEGELQVMPDVDTAAVMAWKNGYISFDGHTLEINLKQLARWYDLQVQHTGNLPSIQLTGRIDKHLPLSEVIKKLSAINVKTKFESPNKLTILE